MLITKSKKIRDHAWVSITFLISTTASYAVPNQDKDLAQARILYQNAATNEASELCSKKIAAGKNLAQWHEMLAKTLNLSRGGSAKAETEIKKAMEAAPHDENIIASAGLIIANVGTNCASILPKLQQAIKEHPKNGRLHAALSDCYEAMHNSLSEQEMVTAIKLDPTDFDVNLQAIDHYSKLQKQDEIYNAYARAIKGSPRSAYLYAERGVFERDNYKYEAASKDLQKAIELNPKYTYAYSMLAKALKKGLKLPEAIKVYDFMLSKSKDDPNLLGRRAYCYSHTNQFDKAIKDYDQSLKIYGNGAAFVPQKSAENMAKDQRLDYNKYWLERAECREHVGQIDQGIHELSSYIAGATHPTSAYEIRQRLYRRKGQYDKALVDLNYLIQKDAFVADNYTARAEVFAKLGRIAESKQDLKHAENIEATGSP